jgi:hypothetical protein
VVKENRRRTYEDITGIMNVGNNHRFCTRTITRKIQELGYKRRIAKKKVAIREANKKARCKWCKERRIGLLIVNGINGCLVMKVI